MNIIVTGASRGIGYELVKKFTTWPGNHVLAISRNMEKLLMLQQEVKDNPSECSVLSTDLSRISEGEFYESKISPVFDRVDVVVNNAGALVNKPFRELTGNDFDIMFNTNVRAVFLLVRELLPHFGPESHIVNISSMGGVQGSSKFPGLSLYSSSKGAVTILTECMAEEFKDMGIKVNGLALGAAATEMLAEAFPGYEAPLSAGEMAGFIADFALTGSKFFNGKVLPVAVSTP